MLLSEILMLLVDDFDKKAKELSNVVRVIIKAKKVTRIDGTIFRFAGLYFQRTCAIHSDSKIQSMSSAARERILPNSFISAFAREFFLGHSKNQDFGIKFPLFAALARANFFSAFYWQF